MSRRFMLGLRLRFRRDCPSSFALLSCCSRCSPASGVHNEKLLSRCYCHCLWLTSILIQRSWEMHNFTLAINASSMGIFDSFPVKKR